MLHTQITAPAEKPEKWPIEKDTYLLLVRISEQARATLDPFLREACKDRLVALLGEWDAVIAGTGQ